MQLDLSSNQLCGISHYGDGSYTAEGIKAIADALGVNASLTAIDISDNLEGDEGMRVLGKGLLASTSSKLTSLKCSKFDLQADATSLDLSNKSLGPGAVMLLSAAMSKFMASLTECNVRSNNLDNESATALTKISAPKGIMLFGIKHGQKEASFCDQGLGPVDAILIANDLLVSTSLTSVR